MKRSLFTIIFLFLVISSNYATTYYVSKAGDDSNNGLSWVTSKLSIQGAIDSASSGDSIFVSVGNYDGFTLKSGVHVFGGFVGSETFLYQRQHLTFGYLQNGLATNITTTIYRNFNLSYYHFKIFCKDDGAAVITTYIDGIVIPKSASSDYTVLLRGSFVIKNSTISDRVSNVAVFCKEGNPSFDNVKFTDCSGIAIKSNDFSTIYINNCVFENNLSPITSIKDGRSNNSWMYFNNCLISNNKTNGLVDCDSKGSAKFSKCTINNNVIKSNGGGGAFRWKSGGSLIFRDCIIKNNYCYDSTAKDSTLSIFDLQNSSALKMANCIVANNTVNNKYNTSNCYASIVYHKGSNNSLLQNCTFVNNKSIVKNSLSKAYVLRTPIWLGMYNDVFWGNSSNVNQNFIGYYHQDYFLYNALMQRSISHLQGTGNFILDTLNTGSDSTKNYVRFVRPTTFAGAATNSADSLAIMQADWHLDSGSACIDAGHPYQISLPYQDSLDLDGNHRVSGGRIDIGAYEYPQADAPQQIVWSQNLQGKRLSEGFVVATATATSGLPVTYTSGNTRVATVSHDTIFFQSRGNATITATQWGDSVYMPATPLGKMLTVLDTIGVYDTIPVYDTVRSYDTVHTQVFDTLWTNDTIRTQVFDTLWTNDTIWHNDTTHTQVFDTTWTHLFDTIPVYDTTTIYIYDTIHIIDTIHIYDTTHVSIQGAEAVPWKIGQSGGCIIVSGAEGETVKVYDVSGRCLHVQPRAVGVLRFRMPTAGVYLVQVGGSPAQRVVITQVE